jgi:glucose/arabinose dehydrogenase
LQLNHGLEISGDGKTVYASSSESVWSWSYDAARKSVSGQKLLVTNMTTDDHTTRTVLLSQKAPGILLVSRGSTSNIDLTAASPASGHSQIKAFNLTNMTGQAYQFDTSGLRLGWGLRNSVGIAEHPVTGGIYSVENSADQITRGGQDIHENNPGDEMNFHGYLNGTRYSPQGQNYGYPYCFAAWDVSDIPNNANLSIGSQFSIDGPAPLTHSLAKTDAYCAQQIPPRLTFQAHTAPLDIVFNNSGTEAWTTFHGSWYVD